MSDAEKTGGNGEAAENYPKQKFITERQGLLFARHNAEMVGNFKELENLKSIVEKAQLEAEIARLKYENARLTADVRAHQIDIMRREVEAKTVAINEKHVANLREIAQSHDIDDFKDLIIDADSLSIKVKGVDVPPLVEGE